MTESNWARADDNEQYLQTLSLLIKPTGPDCNLWCDYCFYRPKRALYPGSRRHEMPREVMHALIRQYMEMAGPMATFSWQGGEPTLLGIEFFRRVVAVEQQYGRPGQIVGNALQTNGILLDDEWARLLRRYKFLVGLSLDGPREIHDLHRRDAAGRPTFDQVMRAVEVLRYNGVEFNILCMVTRDSADKADELWDFFVKLGVDYVQFIPCVERHPRTGKLRPYSCTPDQYARFLCRIHDRWTETELPLMNVRDLDDILLILSGVGPPSCIWQPQCGSYLLVEHNGDVYPCDFFVEGQWKLGNIMETPLRDIALSPRFREFAQRKANLSEQCRGCRWLYLCHGGCPRHRLAAGPDVCRPSYFCEAYRLFFQRCDQWIPRFVQRLKPDPAAKNGTSAKTP